MERWGQVALVGLGGGRWAGVTDLAAPAVRHLPPNLRVTHGPAIMANGIPGGSPTRAPSSLGPREPPLPPFGEPMLGSIGRQLCLSRPGPRLPSLLRAGPGLRGPRGCLAPGCAHVEPGWVGIGGGAGLGVLGTCPGLRLGDGHWARVHVCAYVSQNLKCTWRKNTALTHSEDSKQQGMRSAKSCSLFSLQNELRLQTQCSLQNRHNLSRATY